MVDRSRIALESLRLAASDKNYHDVLGALAAGIAEGARRLDDLSADDEWFDLVVDDECDIVEELLGASFVVCQTKVTAVSAAAMRLHAIATSEGNSGIPEFKSKKSVRSFGNIHVDSKLPEVELVWALANYFKHRDEWQGLDWTKLPKPSRATADVLSSIGLSSGSTGNLRTGCRALGNESYVNWLCFTDTVDSWAMAVLKCAENSSRAGAF